MNVEVYKIIVTIAGVIIVGLFGVIFYFLQSYVIENKEYRKCQEIQNGKFYELINNTNLVLKEISTTMKIDREICDIRHNDYKNKNK